MKDFEIPTGNAHRKQTGNKTDLPGRIWHGRSSDLPGNPNLPERLFQLPDDALIDLADAFLIDLHYLAVVGHESVDLALNVGSLGVYGG